MAFVPYCSTTSKYDLIYGVTIIWHYDLGRVFHLYYQIYEHKYTNTLLKNIFIHDLRTFSKILTSSSSGC